MTRATRHRRPQGYTFDELPATTHPRRGQRPEGPQVRQNEQADKTPHATANAVPDDHIGDNGQGSELHQRPRSETPSAERPGNAAVLDPRLNTNLMQGSDGQPLRDRFPRTLVELYLRSAMCEKSLHLRAIDIAEVEKKRKQRARRLRRHLLDLSPYRQDLLRGDTLSQVVRNNEMLDSVDAELWTSYLAIKKLSGTIAQEQQTELTYRDSLAEKILDTIVQYFPRARSTPS